MSVGVVLHDLIIQSTDVLILRQRPWHAHVHPALGLGPSYLAALYPLVGFRRARLGVGYLHALTPTRRRCRVRDSLRGLGRSVSYVARSDHRTEQS